MRSPHVRAAFISHHFLMLTHRLRHALSQEELARLLGKASHSAISRYEQRGVVPPLRTLLGYEVVFGLGLKAMIPDLYREIEEEIVARGNALWTDLEGRSDHGAAQKRALLLDMVARASASSEVA